MTDPSSIRTSQELADAVECAIGLNVDCGGSEGVHRVRDAVLAAIRPVWDRLAEYENTITWHTTCTNCARILDSAIRETERAERAEGAIARARALHQPVGVVAAAEFGNLPDCAICGPNCQPSPTIRALDDEPAAPAATQATDQTAHNAGPTVAECAANDRAHWTEKYAGEQP